MTQSGDRIWGNPPLGVYGWKSRMLLRTVCWRQRTALAYAIPLATERTPDSWISVTWGRRWWGGIRLEVRLNTATIRDDAVPSESHEDPPTAA